MFFERYVLSWISFHRTLVGNASIPGEMVYPGKEGGAICCRLYSLRYRTLGIEEVRSRGSPGICRGGREPFNFDVCDNFSTRARPDSKWRCVLGDRSFDQGLAQIGRERCDRTLGNYHL
ncbi:MAG: hypothetical protein RLP97_13640 [Coleofasciculus chthonoplastes F2-STO-03]